MLDLRVIRDRTEEVRANLRNRNVQVDLERLLEADRLVRETIGELEAVRRRRNEIGAKMKGSLPKEERAPLVEEGRGLKEKEPRLESRHRELEAERNELQQQVPNLTHPNAPVGADEEDNRVLREHGERPQLDFEPKDHVELMEALELVDFEGGAKVAGPKFYYLKNEAVLLEQALVNFASVLLREEGFTLFITPDLARQEIL